VKDRQDIDDIPDSEVEVTPSDDPGETDPAAAVENAEPYFPPTDPVLRVPEHGEARIAGGFGSGEIREDSARGVVNDVSADEGLEDLVHRELRLDASTADLRLKVGVRDGVVLLEGDVPDETDAENALAVAGRVPGVVDVIDQLTRP
jgi:hypothetical protein